LVTINSARTSLISNPPLSRYLPRLVGKKYENFNQCAECSGGDSNREPPEGTSDFCTPKCIIVIFLQLVE